MIRFLGFGLITDGTLSQTRIKELNAMGFIWDALDHRWEERKRQLHKFIVDNGHAYVPHRDPILGYWVSRIRGQRNNGTLSEDRFEQLTAMGFIWDARDYRWKTMYKDLCDYKAQHKTIKVKKEHNPRSFSREEFLKSCFS